MRVLVYTWGSVCEPGLIRNIKKCGDKCEVISGKLADYHADAKFAEQVIRTLLTNRIEVVFSYDYIPLLSMVCDIHSIPYVAWIYDCPQYTLYSKTIGNDCNHIFCFDKWLAAYVEELGGRNVYSMPLGTDVEGFQNVLQGKDNLRDGKSNNISFVGSLYENKAGKIWEMGLSSYQIGYLEGIIEAQRKIYGYPMIADVLSDELCEEITEKGNLRFSDWYIQDVRQMAVDAVNYEVSYRERIKVLEALGKHWEVDFYSNSLLPKELDNISIIKKGYVDYEAEMPFVFRDSKVNINITSKTIPSGIPQRVLDIMGCGGFCITNYQPEIAECFAEGEEIVMYESMEDLVRKTYYYLEHEEERRKIVAAGHKRVCEEFALDKQWKKMMEQI